MLFCRLWNSSFKEFFYHLQKIVPSLSSVLWQDAGKPNLEIAWLFRKFTIYYSRIHLTDHEFLLHLRMNQKLLLIVITIWYLQQLLLFEDGQSLSWSARKKIELLLKMNWMSPSLLAIIWYLQNVLTTEDGIVIFMYWKKEYECSQKLNQKFADDSAIWHVQQSLIFKDGLFLFMFRKKRNVSQAEDVIMKSENVYMDLHQT